MRNAESKYIIVAATDYSPQSDLALEQAFLLAQREENAEVHVVHVLALGAPQAVPPYELTGLEAISIPEAQEQLQRHVALRLDDFNQKQGITQPGSQKPAPFGSLGRVVCHLRFEVPHHEIAQLATDLEADLVVLGTHGRKGPSRWLMGSVAEVVVRLSPCPVLVVRPKAAPPPTPQIEPPCPRCVEARFASQGKVFWCDQHSERHGQRHTYHQSNRIAADATMPLVHVQGR
jgi:nucleotide-binding universal stress UspA family protein